MNRPNTYAATKFHFLSPQKSSVCNTFLSKKQGILFVMKFTRERIFRILPEEKEKLFRLSSKKNCRRREFHGSESAIRRCRLPEKHKRTSFNIKTSIFGEKDEKKKRKKERNKNISSERDCWNVDSNIQTNAESSIVLAVVSFALTTLCEGRTRETNGSIL